MEETRKWQVLPRERNRARGLAGLLNISEVTAQLLLNRGICEVEDARNFFYDCMDGLGDPSHMRGVNEAKDFIRRALALPMKIRIFGDYDADGVTSTVLLLKFLKQIGANVDYYIPHRVEEGYGLSETGILKAAREGVSLIITVDCGVSDLKEIALAKSLGMNVIIIDHHEISTDLPEADVIINPRNPRCPYPFKKFAGVGVVAKLIQGMCTELSLPFLNEYIELVTLGTVADAVPLVGENRILVKEGLKILSASSSPGILSLLEMGSRRSYPLTVKDLSCFIVPRINAAGRIEHADLAVQLLMSNDLKEAVQLAQELDGLNRRRQKIEEQIREEVLKAFESDRSLQKCSAIVMTSHSWHPGVLGITAYRVSEIIGKPVFLIAIKDGVGKGSARTADGLNLFENMKRVEDLFLHYGGHYAAGGFGILEKDIPELKERLNGILEEKSLFNQACADMEIRVSEITMEMINELKLLEPFGEGNPLPLFMCRGVNLENIKSVGDGSHLRFVLRQDNCLLDGIAFHMGDMKDCLFYEDLKYDLIISPEVDNFRGVSKLLAKVQDILYPDANSHLIISGHGNSFSVFENRGEMSQGQTVPLIIDSRNVCNRIKYIKEILRYASYITLVVRTIRQVKALERTFRDEGIEIFFPGSETKDIRDQSVKGVFIFLSGQIFDTITTEDILFFSPPPSLRHFSNPLYRKIKRIHFLFNEDDIEFEERLQNISVPTVGKVMKIVNLLYELPAGEVSPPDMIAERLNDSLIKKITIEIAFRILTELDLLEKREGGVFFNKSFLISEKDLEASTLFCSLLEQKSSFLHFKELYENSFDELRSEILSLIAIK